jgi:hypothetical protein
MILPEHKKFIINGLYGLIEGSASSLESMLKSNFKHIFGFIPDSIKVTQKNKFIGENEQNKGCWIGEMTVTLIIDGKEFVVTRDWAEEYENDIKHPNYQDDYFYDSEDCFSYKKCNELLESISPKRIAKDRLKNF